ncbi:MAG: flavodoxin [Desulfovibrio sp.]|nr:flavodoxin [Desulfovibrio sp.]
MAETGILIAYFSHPGQNYVNGDIVELEVGNTEVAAKKLAAITGARLVRIEQAQNYPEDYHELTEVAKKELKAGARPPLKNALPDMIDVSYLFLGYPNWWGTMPMPVWTFLEAVDTAGIKIAPFCTNEGSGMGRSEKDLRALCPQAEICAGLPIIGHRVADSDAALRAWAAGILR